MLRRKILGLAAALAIGVPICFADSFSLSLTGALNNTEASFSVPVTLVTTGTINLQTYGFGGGANAAGSVIPAGGFDPFVGLFEGTGAGAVFLNGTSDELTNYAPGCPPAGTVTIGSVSGQCGDVFLSFPVLAAGTYTVILSDAGRPALEDCWSGVIPPLSLTYASEGRKRRGKVKVSSAGGTQSSATTRLLTTGRCSFSGPWDA